MKLFVAGASGAIGRPLTRRLTGRQPRYPSWRDGFRAELG